MRAQLTTQQAGEVVGLSDARLSQIEADDANLYISTVVEVAARFGYRATLVHRPIAGGQKIEVLSQGNRLSVQAKEGAGASIIYIMFIKIFYYSRVKTAMKKVKLLFRLEQDEYGYPPVAIESVWTTETSQHTFIIDSTPFYIRGISLGDEVMGELVGDEIFCSKFLNASSNSTYRIWLADVRCYESVASKLNELSCQFERGHIPNLVSVNVPDSADAAAVHVFMKEGGAVELFDFEEAALRGKSSIYLSADV